MNKMLLPLVFCFAFSMAQGQSRNTPYDFPVKPGTEEWKKLTTGEEMFAACAIPEKVLKSLTTEALAQTCLNFPLLNEVFYAADLQKGITSLAQYFNGLGELYARKDAAEILFSIYAKKQVQDVDALKTEEQQGAFTLEFTYLELLLAQTTIINRLNSEQRVLLAREAVLKYDKKKERLPVFGEFGLTTPLYIMAKVLSAESKLADVTITVGEAEVQTFLSTVMFSNTATQTAIYNAAARL